MNKPDDGFDPDDIKIRRARGLLAWDVDMICRQYVTGGVTLNEGKFLTAYYIAKLIKELDQLEEPPSIGAVSKVLERWHQNGYANCRQEPFAFTSYTDLGEELGLELFFERFPVLRKNAKGQA